MYIYIYIYLILEMIVRYYIVFGNWTKKSNDVFCFVDHMHCINYVTNMVCSERNRSDSNERRKSTSALCCLIISQGAVNLFSYCPIVRFLHKMSLPCACHLLSPESIFFGPEYLRKTRGIL